MINGMPAPNASNTRIRRGPEPWLPGAQEHGSQQSENVKSCDFTDGVATAFPGQFDVNTSGKPHCDSSTKDGIFPAENNGASVLDGSGRINRPRNLAFPRLRSFPELLQTIPDNNGNHYGQDLLSGGFRATWQPPGRPAIALTGVNSVNLNNPHQGK